MRDIDIIGVACLFVIQGIFIAMMLSDVKDEIRECPTQTLSGVIE